MVRSLTPIAALAIASQVPQEAEAQTPPSGTLQSIRLVVRGNARSADSYVESLARRCLEISPPSPQDSTEFEQCLMNSRQFVKVRVTRPQSDTLDIEVEDRWTLIAVPVFMQNSAGETSVGAFGVESNFLGYGKLLLAGALWSTRGMFFTLGFQDRSIAFTRWRAGFSLSQVVAESRFRVDGKNVEDAFKEDALSSGLTLGYETSHGLTPQWGLEWSDRSFKRLSGFEPPPSLRQVRATGSLAWRDTSYKLYFDEGPAMNVALQTSLWKSQGPVTWTATANVQEGISAFGEQALLLQANGLASWGRDRREWRRLGGGPGLRGFLAASLWAKQMATLAADYQIPLWQGSPGTWTLAPFLDTGTILTAHDKNFAFASEGVGTYFFLKRVALPGVGLVVGYNHKTKRFLGQFALGGGGP